MKLPCFSVVLSLAMALPLAADPVKPTAPDAPSAPATPSSPADSNVKHLGPEEAAKLVETAASKPADGKDITVIDVRSPEEFASGHLKGAKNIDIASPDFKDKLAKLDRNKTYLLHCGSGGRSTRSLSLLNQLGFKSVLHLDGGLNSWKKAGLPLEKPAAK